MTAGFVTLQNKRGNNRPVIAGKKIAVFCLACLGISAVVGVSLRLQRM